ncbi:MAG: hypothetical protein V3V01_07950, partial [Acidimicrobiales bacterium]
MNPTDFSRATDEAIGYLGGAFMVDDHTNAIGEEYGLDFAGFYGLGRGSVLGDTHPQVVAAAYPFIAPELVEAIWAGAIDKLAPHDATAAYARACQQWGHRNLTGFEGLERLTELTSKIVDNAGGYWGALFAGWREVALPDDLEGRAAQVLHVLRELRGGVHVMALLAAGLQPLEAVLASDGPEGAAQYFWPEPYPDPSQFRVAQDAAVETTHELF